MAGVSKRRMKKILRTAFSLAATGGLCHAVRIDVFHAKRLSFCFKD
jgi:hypothetical protein